MPYVLEKIVEDGILFASDYAGTAAFHLWFRREESKRHYGHTKNAILRAKAVRLYGWDKQEGESVEDQTRGSF